MSEPAASETTEEGKSNVTVESSIPPQLAVLHDKKHPLEHSWCFWYDSRWLHKPFFWIFSFLPFS